MSLSKEVYKRRFEQIANMAKERDKDLDGWFRWIVAIAVGCLSVLIPLSKSNSMSWWATFFFRSTCVSMGAGLVALSIRIHALHVSKQSLISELVKAFDDEEDKPHSGQVPNWMMKCEIVGYAALLLGVCCLIAFACFR